MDPHIVLVGLPGSGKSTVGPLVSGVFKRGSKQASELQQTRALREEREEIRKIDTELRAKRAPVKIEPPPAPVVEKSERAKRETQIPLFNAGDGTGFALRAGCGNGTR